MIAGSTTTISISFGQAKIRHIANPGSRRIKGKILTSIDSILLNPRITIRRAGQPDPEGKCVVYWMQRAQRGIDNPALDVALQLANELHLPVAVFFGLHPNYPHGNLRHYTFLVDGLAETARCIEQRGAAFVYRPFPHHNLLKFCAEVKPALVVGDENPLREPSLRRAPCSPSRN